MSELISVYVWRNENNYIKCDMGAYCLFVSRVGKSFRWNVRKAQGSILLPMVVGYKDSVEDAMRECEKAYEDLCKA